ncbi:unnamed protein product [Coffea canephora]|uniref:Uncharacterized protein n=1 Tax=Coffea canephora TaxID=49390 RepID=A0A068V3T8_COFCA|nr:unnamed protein product [Coffea canephora]
MISSFPVKPTQSKIHLTLSSLTKTSDTAREKIEKLFFPIFLLQDQVSVTQVQSPLATAYQTISCPGNPSRPPVCSVRSRCPFHFEM